MLPYSTEMMASAHMYCDSKCTWFVYMYTFTMVKYVLVTVDWGTGEERTPTTQPHIEDLSSTSP
jgi:hypothetical protein